MQIISQALDRLAYIDNILVALEEEANPILIVHPNYVATLPQMPTGVTAKPTAPKPTQLRESNKIYFWNFDTSHLC